MVYLGQLLRTTVPGVRVFCWDLGNLTAAEASHPCIGGGDFGPHCSERVWSSSNVQTPLQTQLETLMERVRATAALEDGFSLFGYSQGGVLARALVQMRPPTWGNRWAPRVLVTLDAPHAGIALAPTNDHGLVARLLRDEYEHDVQGMRERSEPELTMTDFVKDCERIGTYYKSSWLASLNNEVPGRRRADYAERLRRLRAMVLLASAHDGVVYPTASQTLAFLPCDPVLGASLNDTFDGDGAAELGATIDNGGDTDLKRTAIKALGGGEGAQVELPLGALGSGLATRRTLSYREVLEHQNTRTPGRTSLPLTPSALRAGPPRRALARRGGAPPLCRALVDPLRGDLCAHAAHAPLLRRAHRAAPDAHRRRCGARRGGGEGEGGARPPAAGGGAPRARRERAAAAGVRVTE